MRSGRQSGSDAMSETILLSKPRAQHRDLRGTSGIGASIAIARAYGQDPRRQPLDRVDICKTADIEAALKAAAEANGRIRRRAQRRDGPAPPAVDTMSLADVADTSTPIFSAARPMWPASYEHRARAGTPRALRLQQLHLRSGVYSTLQRLEGCGGDIDPGAGRGMVGRRIKVNCVNPERSRRRCGSRPSGTSRRKSLLDRRGRRAQVRWASLSAPPQDLSMTSLREGCVAGLPGAWSSQR